MHDRVRRAFWNHEDATRPVSLDKRRTPPVVGPRKRVSSACLGRPSALRTRGSRMRSVYLDMRWTLVVSGLEALINVGKNDNKWQFRDRGVQLANEARIGLTDHDLKIAWELRSKIVHAERFLYGLETILPRSQHNDLYEKLEGLLRMTLRRCLLDGNFGSFFCDDHAVEARWPLNPNRAVK